MVNGSLVKEPFKQYCSRPADQRFETMAALRAAVGGRAQLSREVRTDGENLHVEPVQVGDAEDGYTSMVLTMGNGQPMALSHWAFGQVCSRAGAPAEYMRRLPSQLAANCLDHGLRHVRNDQPAQVKVLDYGLEEDDGFRRLRAVTGPDYGRIWDMEVVDLVQGVIDRTNGRFTNPPVWERNADGTHKRGGLYASDRDVFMFLIDGGSIVDGGGDRDQLHRGFIAWNSEVGYSALGLAAFLFRVCCGNHQIWGIEGLQEVRLRHSARAPERFWNEVSPVLIQHVEASARPLEAQIRKAKALELSPELPKLLAFGKQHGFSGTEVRLAKDYCEREEQQDMSNVWLFIQGLTAAARDMAHVDARVNLERRASKLMELAA